MRAPPIPDPESRCAPPYPSATVQVMTTVQVMPANESKELESGETRAPEPSVTKVANEKYDNAFDEADADHDGFLTRAEMKVALGKLDLAWNDERLTTIMNKEAVADHNAIAKADFRKIAAEVSGWPTAKLRTPVTACP